MADTPFPPAASGGPAQDPLSASNTQPPSNTPGWDPLADFGAPPAATPMSPVPGALATPPPAAPLSPLPTLPTLNPTAPADITAPAAWPPPSAVPPPAGPSATAEPTGRFGTPPPSYTPPAPLSAGSTPATDPFMDPFSSDPLAGPGFPGAASTTAPPYGQAPATGPSAYAGMPVPSALPQEMPPAMDPFSAPAPQPLPPVQPLPVVPLQQFDLDQPLNPLPTPPAMAPLPQAPVAPTTFPDAGFPSAPQANQAPLTEPALSPLSVGSPVGFAAATPAPLVQSVPSQPSPFQAAAPEMMSAQPQPVLTPMAGTPADIFAQPMTDQSGQPLVPPMDTQGVPTLQQSALSQEEHEELFGRERLSGTQKAIIVVIALVAIGLVVGLGFWGYQRFNGGLATGQASSPTTDTDGDGLTDAKEATLGTNANAVDTDGDGYLDGDEVAGGYDPLAKPEAAATK